jgi:hypothetical protein
MKHGEVSYFPIDNSAAEKNESCAIILTKNGDIDLSQLPEKERKNLENFGLPNEVSDGRVFPKDGEEFLNALERSTNGYRIFRE